MTSLPPESDFTNPMPMPSPRGLDMLPPELEGIQRDLIADATQWERGVPPAARFNQRLRAVLPLEASTGATGPASHEMRPRTPGETVNAPRRMPTHTRPAPLSTALALVATVAVVALLAAVVATLRPGGMATKTTTALAGTPTATLPAPGPVKTLPLRATYTGQPGIPVVAANNPNVIYEYSTGADTSAVPYTPILRRSDDGGASWHALAYPAAPGAHVGSLTLAVNPTDAANVYLSVALGFPPGAAGACRQASPGDALVICTGEYVSTDSGAHWAPMNYPLPGTLFPVPTPNSVALDYDPGIVQAQGSRVYATLLYHNTQTQPATEVRILSSTDHGTTWHVADAALAATGAHICDFEAAPVGATLFARTAAVCQGADFTSRQLWRSDDAGAHWRQVTSFAAPFNTIDNSFTLASAGDHLIIYDGTFDQQANEVHYYASLDGGVSWQPAPTAGLPAGAQGVWLPTKLGDGSLVVAYMTGTSSGGSPAGTANPTPTITSTTGPQQDQGRSIGTLSPMAKNGASPTPTPSPTLEGPQASGRSITCYAWKPGLDHWVPLTQPITISTLMTMNIFTVEGTQRVVVLTLVDDTTSSMTYTIERFG